MRAVFAAIALFACTSALAAPAALTVTVTGLADKEPIPDAHVYCQPNAEKHMEDGRNLRPAISWTAGPEGTKSYAVIVEDPDVPASFDDAYKEDRVIRASAARQPFYHWAQIDIPATVTAIPTGAGKVRSYYGRTITNDVVKDKEKKPAYAGPCPPFNDLRVHHYHFRVYALDVASLTLPEGASAKDAAKEVKKHAIAQGELVGTYTLNPDLRK